MVNKETPADIPELYLMLIRITNKIKQVERILEDFGLPDPLYVSEIHTIQAIGNNPDNNVKMIAELTGVSSSAASQVITKLKKRGLVRKIHGARNEKEILLKLTKKGLVAYKIHEKTHAEKCECIHKEIGPLSLEERAAVERVLSAVEMFFTRSIEENSLVNKKKPEKEG